MAYIKGKWKWNKVVYDTDATPVESKVVFTSNGEQFDEIIVFSETVYGSFEIQYMNLEMLISAGRNYAQGEMFCEIEEKYRTMDFGETEQDIDDSLNEFILANASEVSPISEKLVEVANNVPKVFDAGKAQGHGEGYEAGYNKGYNEGLDTDAYDEGKKAEYDTFWDAFQENGERTVYSSAFERWADTCFNPKYDMKPTSCDRMFNRSLIADIAATLKKNGVMLDTSKATNLYAIFNNTITKRVPTISAESATSLEAAFAWNQLETIDKLILKSDGTNTFYNTFKRADMLKNITFEGVIGNDIDFRDCTKLTYNSIVSIINHLSDNTTAGNTLTLSKEAVDREFEWSIEIVGEILVIPGTHEDNPVWWPLRAKKPNWTINYA